MTAPTQTDRVNSLAANLTATDPDYIGADEVTDVIAEFPNKYRAAAELCRRKAARWTNTVNADSATAAQEKWLKLAAALDAQAAKTGGGIYVGGSSISDNETLDEDTDLVQPKFRIDGDSADGQYGYSDESQRWWR